MPEPLASRNSRNVRTTPWQLRAIRLAFRLLSPLAPGLAGRWALRLFRTVRPFPRPEREARWLAEARPLAVELDGRPLAAWSWGEEGRPAVLLAHGWESRGSQLGALVAPLLERGFRVIAWDAPGHGDTGGGLSSMPQFAAALARVAALTGPVAGIVAHSFGVAATCYALDRGSIAEPERLVFLCPPADLGLYTHHTAHLLGLPPTVEARMLAQLEAGFAVDWEADRRITRKAARDLPVLIVADRDDAETPPAMAREVAGAWPRARLLETAGFGHRRILRAPEVVSETVGFLAAASEEDDEDEESRSPLLAAAAG